MTVPLNQTLINKWILFIVTNMESILHDPLSGHFCAFEGEGQKGKEAGIGNLGFQPIYAGIHLWLWTSKIQ